MNKTFRKPLLLLLLVAVIGMTIGGSAYAKSKSTGITAGEAVSQIVKGLGLNIDNIRFIKEPKASDYYTKVKDDSAYAGDFIIAQYNGLDVPKNVDPQAKVTREQFAKWLYGALSHKGEFSWIELYVNVADAKAVSSGHMDGIQKLLIAKIATLDGKQRFHPKNPVSRTEASALIARTVKFIADNAPATQPEQSVLSNVTLTTEKVSDGVLRVKLTATVPHPGYGLEITGIRFSGKQASIDYRAVQPDPDKMYPQVVTDISATTYVASTYTPVLGEAQPSAPFAG